jgi:predicted HicB family RNase H-like nuclease
LTHGQRRGKATERFTTRLPASIHARLLEAANADHRSLTDVALIAIEIHLDTLHSRAAGKRRSTSSLNARE